MWRCWIFLTKRINYYLMLQRYGVWADWDNPYLTLDPEYEAAQVLLLHRSCYFMDYLNHTFIILDHLLTMYKFFSWRYDRGKIMLTWVHVAIQLACNSAVSIVFNLIPVYLSFKFVDLICSFLTFHFMDVVKNGRSKCLARWQFKVLFIEVGNQFTGVPHHELLLQRPSWR